MRKEQLCILDTILDQKREKRPNTVNLSLLEHKMIGSSLEMGGEILDVNALLRQAAEGNKQALRTLLTPQIILEKDKSLGNVDRINSSRREMELEASILLADEWITELSLKYKLGISLRLSGLSREGIIIPEWTMQLVDGKKHPVSNRDILGKLGLDSSLTLGKYLELKPAESDSDTRTLVLKLPPLTSTPASNAV